MALETLLCTVMGTNRDQVFLKLINSFPDSELQAWRYKILLCQQIKLDARNKIKNKEYGKTVLKVWRIFVLFFVCCCFLFLRLFLKSPGIGFILFFSCQKTKEKLTSSFPE